MHPFRMDLSPRPSECLSTLWTANRIVHRLPPSMPRSQVATWSTLRLESRGYQSTQQHRRNDERVKEQRCQHKQAKMQAIHGKRCLGCTKHVKSSYLSPRVDTLVVYSGSFRRVLPPLLTQALPPIKTITDVVSLCLFVN